MKPRNSLALKAFRTESPFLLFCMTFYLHMLAHKKNGYVYTLLFVLRSLLPSREMGLTHTLLYARIKKKGYEY